MVCYPNRDSSTFREFYNIPEVQNLVRGTMRFGGFCEVVEAWKELGFLSDSPVDYCDKNSTLTWVQLTAKLAGSEPTEECVHHFFFADLPPLQSAY